MNALLYPDQRNADVSHEQNPVAFWLIAALASYAMHCEIQAMLNTSSEKRTEIRMHTLVCSARLINEEMKSDIRHLACAGGLLYFHDRLTQQHLNTLIAGGAA